MKLLPAWAVLLTATVLFLSAGAGARAQKAIIPVVPKPEAPKVFAASNAKARAAWQKHLTLGPNDVINISYYGKSELDRANLLIGPDGRLSYLQAQGVMASGLTIDELRDVMTTEIAKYYRNPRLMISPGEFRSKKFYILGKIVDKGAFTLDRPLTLLEGVAQAGGLETGLYQLNTVELADFQRSFLIRNRQRVAVDFEKLFREGDLSQNILLEPDDYLYFPSANNNEIYVLGSVKSPGAQGLDMNANVLQVVTLAGGFTERAFKERVLVVRGSLDHPQRIIVDCGAALAAKALSFRLQPRDIIYVSDQPWARVEDLADLAATSFIETVVTIWTGGNIGPLITHPFVPTLK